MDNPKTIEDLINDYCKFPGVGNKTATRLAYSTINFTEEEIDAFIEHLSNIKTKLKKCPICNLLHDKEVCPICNDSSRDQTTLMIICDGKNILQFENTNQYHGLYFALKDYINPSKGNTPSTIGIPQLINYINSKNFKEIILSFSPTLEGETTSLYIAKLLKDTPIKVSRLAYGLPFGSDLEYIDELTIASSLKERVDMKQSAKNSNKDKEIDKELNDDEY